MDKHAYPGEGLSLSQLVFALKEELRHTAYSPSFTPDAISQLDRDTSTALATIREWRNSFAHINRVPVDVLSRIPLHLVSQKDRFRATFVCRHWRRTFLQHSALWSQLFLGRDEAYVETLLDRAKGSTLDVIASFRAPINALMVLLSPRSHQIRYLEFAGNTWDEIVKFSEANNGPLPLLRTLKLAPMEPPSLVVTPPPTPFFGGAANLDKFVLDSNAPRYLNHFVFPSLTTLELTTSPFAGLDASELLNFLKASPMLRTIQVKVSGEIVLEDIPRELVVVLPNVETFSLTVSNGSGLDEIATHISCPYAKHTSLNDEIDDDYLEPDTEMFPTPTMWNAIVPQYTRSPIEEVILDISPGESPVTACSLIFRSSDGSVISLGSEVFNTGADVDDLELTLEEIGCEVFCQALRTIGDHPLVSNIKFLQINFVGIFTYGRYLVRIANEFGRLFRSLGSLDILSIRSCDYRSCLAQFLDIPELNSVERGVAHPPIKELKISHPPLLFRSEECQAAIVALAKSQYERGVSFERLTIPEKGPFTDARMLERLKPWVGTVDYVEERS